MEKERITKHINSENLVSIDTIADGNCLIHSILKSCYKDYQENSNVSFRRDIATGYRKKLSEYVLESNPDYPTEQDVVEMVKSTFKTKSPRGFLDFLRTMYNYTNKFIHYPYQPLSIKELSKYNKDGVNKYYKDYFNYINDIKIKISNQIDKNIRVPSIEKFYKVLDEENDNLEYIENIYLKLNNYYEEFEKFIDEYISRIREILEYVLGYKLYLPIHFNSNIIESILNHSELNDESIQYINQNIPKGIYKDYKFNSNLFTISEGTPLLKFEYEYNEVEDIVKLSDIPSYLNSRRFIGDADCMLYIPHILNVNLIIMNFEECGVIAIYENPKSSYYVITNNIYNTHFETVGIIDTKGYIQTLFEDSHPLIKECLKREHKINLECLNIKVEAEVEIISPNISIEEKVRKAFGDRIEKFRLLEQEHQYAYIVLKESKSLYRIYINEKLDIVSGYAPERIKYKLKSL